MENTKSTTDTKKADRKGRPQTIANTFYNEETVEVRGLTINGDECLHWSVTVPSSIKLLPIIRCIEQQLGEQVARTS